MGNNNSSSSNTNQTKPIDKAFNFPSPLPSWPTGTNGFGRGYTDLDGGLQVYQATSFTKIWEANLGGPDELGATFYEPELEDGFFMLGSYAQPNNQRLFGWVLLAKDTSTDNNSSSVLQKPTDYTLVWSSGDDSASGYVWLPTAPDGYMALGYVVTATSEKPSVEKVRCVRSDFTEECEAENLIWSSGGYDFYSVRPRVRGIEAQGVSVGTFNIIVNDSDDDDPLTSSSIACLKNNNFFNNSSSCMPDATQLQSLIKEYSPYIYFHPDEIYLPASVNWFFTNGVQLYTTQGDGPVPVEPDGSNLPQGGSNDGSYWLDLPVDEAAKEKVKKGDLPTSEAYLHVKPMLGGTFTDIAIWVFHPFNGPSTAKLGLVDIPLGLIGEHVGDWEHITLRISNFNGVLYKVFLSQHSGGQWVDTPLLEFQGGGNKVVAYSSRNGHALYYQPGLVLQGTADFGIRNDTAKSEMIMDTGERFSIVSYSSSGGIVQEPPWLNYMRKWGPKITYTSGNLVDALPDGSLLDGLVSMLPSEVFGEDGVTGPKVKNSWTGDE